MKHTLKKTGLLLVLALVVALLTGGCAPGAPEDVVWTVHSCQATNMCMYQSMEWLNGELEEFTDGHFTLELFPQSALGYAGSTIYEPIGQDLIQAGGMWGAHVSGRWPTLEAANVAGVAIATGADVAKLNSIVDEIWDECAAAVAEENMVLLGIVNTPGRTIVLTEAPEFPLTGRKIRAGVEWEGKVAEYLGATPVTVEFSEVYMAAQRGVVDGIGTDRPSTLGMKFYEPCPHILEWQLGLNFGYFVANKDNFEALPTEWQDKLVELGRQFTTYADGVQKEGIKEATEELTTLGATFYPVPDEMVEAVIDKIVSEYIPGWQESTPDPQAAELVETLVTKFS